MPLPLLPVVAAGVDDGAALPDAVLWLDEVVELLELLAVVGFVAVAPELEGFPAYDAAAT